MKWFAVSLALIMAAACDRAAAPASSPPPAAPETIMPAKLEMARAFAEQAAYCSGRTDTAHPAFKGCVDWHSAAHAAWALTAYQRISGDETYAPLLEQILDPAKLALELEDLRQRPNFELPYGRAWFLRLALERKRLVGDDRLDALSKEIISTLKDRYANIPPDPRARDYDSATWALLNMLLYARQIGDASTEKFVVGVVRRDIARPEINCSLEDADIGFLSECVTWAWLVGEALPREEFLSWYANWNPGLESLKPLTTFSSAHTHGKNFSRAWGLMRLAEITGDQRLAEAYRAHVAAGWKDWTATRGDYMAVGHWVAQFGMLAIMSMPDEPAP